MRAIRRSRAGFTLIEVVVVVAIVGILAAIAIPAFVGQMRRSQMIDAFRMLDDMKRAEATYFAHYSRYCDVGWNPPALPSGTDQTVLDTSRPDWQSLGVNTDGPQRFRYQAISGTPGSPPPAGVTNMPQDDFWFVVQAQGDLDGDGTAVFVETYSHGDRVFIGSGNGEHFLPQGWE